MDWRQASRLALTAATKAHRALDVDPAARIDVFEVIERIGLVLGFVPLRRLSGAYFAEQDGQPGILVNSDHPLARQRYTGAHELGHHLLGHGTSVDPEDLEPLLRWGGRVPPDHEKQAESFAAWFLMPRKLIRAVLSEMGLERPATADDVYELSLRMGTSYEATARHLRNVRVGGRAMATEPQVNGWVRVRPASIKQRLSGGAPPSNLRNDVLVVSENDHDHSFHLRSGDRLVVRLPEIPSSGYLWRVSAEPHLLEVVSSSFDDTTDDADVDPPSHESAVGVAALRSFVLEVLGEGGPASDELTLVKGRFWDREPVSAAYRVGVQIEPHRRGVAEESLALAA